MAANGVFASLTRSSRSPPDLAEAFIIGADFIGDDRVAMVLGDNIFFGHGLPEMLKTAVRRQSGATVFAYHVRDPARYGVVAFDGDGRAVGIERETTAAAFGTWAVTGLYFFDNEVVRCTAKEVKPSARGELEITDLQLRYLSTGSLHVERLGRGFAWLDTGTFESLIDAASFVQTLETRQGMKVACLEEIAFRQGFIDRGQVLSPGKVAREERLWQLSGRDCRNI